MMRLRRIVLLGAAMAAISAAGLPLAAHAAKPADPLQGDWQLIVEKSTFRPGPGPKGQLRSYRVSGDTEKLSARRHRGEETHARCSTRRSTTGRTIPLRACWAATRFPKRIDALTTESTQKRDGKAAIITRRAVSSDGKTLTVTAKGIAPDGQTLDSILIFERRH